MRDTAQKKTGRKKSLVRLIPVLIEVLLLVFVLLWRTGPAQRQMSEAPDEEYAVVTAAPAETQGTAPEETAEAGTIAAENGVPAVEPTPKRADYSEEASALRITEVMGKNQSALMAEDGSFPDWLEITNFSDKAISLKAWSLSDGGDPWPFPNTEIGAGESLLIYAGAQCGLSTDFALSEGEELTLLDPNGDEADSLWLDQADGDVALARISEGVFELTRYITPGFPNNPEGYDAFQDSLALPESPLIISEVCAANPDSRQNAGGVHPDWVELCNRSSSAVKLSDYFLSDKKSDRFLFLLPERELRPGEYIVVYCSKDFAGEEDARNALHAPFSLGSDAEHLWLTKVDGMTADAVSLRDMPVNGSYGREEGRNGWFYFEENTPGTRNSGGCRHIAAAPEASLAPGQYDGVSELLVELSDPSGSGSVWYTTGGDMSQEKLTRYTEPVRITETTILRAVTLEDGACRSPVSVFSYFVNEGHTFPIVSLVGDNWPEFNSFNISENKFIECGGTVAMYQGTEEVFCRPCGIKLKGFTAVLDKMKKNYGIYFWDRYGSTDLTGLDLFGDGVTTYSSLLLRAGQDWGYEGACMRNELMEVLCHEFSPDMPCLSNRYCILYINGTYYGIYSLKQNMNEDFFASTRGVSEESVEVIHGKPDYKNPLNDIIEFCRFSDMTDPENYAKFCASFDIDNFIDYLVIQSFGGNTDLYNNVKFYHSPEEDGGKWKMVFFDQDKTFYRPEGAVKIIFSFYAKPFKRLTDMALNLCTNPEFKDRLLRRYAEALNTTLSDENIVGLIRDFSKELAPEIERDRARYGLKLSDWKNCVNRLRGYFEDGYSQTVIDNLCQDLSLTAAERSKYFSPN